MTRPSIFSRDYERKMRKRRRRKRITIITIVAILGVAAASFYYKGDLKENFTNIKLLDKFAKNDKIKEKSYDNNEKEHKKEQSKNEVINKSEKVENNDEGLNNKKPFVKEYVVKIEGVEDVVISYTEENNKKMFSDIVASNVEFDISPSKQYVVLMDNSNQNMYLIDINGNSTDITNLQYISSSGKKFPKIHRLERNPDYVWCALPRFLDDNTIIYVSQLPWFNKGERKYIWKYYIDSKIHKHHMGVSGNNIKFGTISENGIEVETDNAVVYVK